MLKFEFLDVEGHWLKVAFAATQYLAIVQKYFMDKYLYQLEELLWIFVEVYIAF
ncbi:hypothetical protein ACF3DV_04285 [Chlorogloeopsis fritschii PCC 9212]|uniref:hypothetical protein n=1 Tax=Chlorogloeopsis fritschii TaxID=1124 RepID=UPI0002DA0DB1|nr:hypothetical protein [Chlorogloeopsis fritschii]